MVTAKDIEVAERVLERMKREYLASKGWQSTQVPRDDSWVWFKRTESGVIEAESLSEALEKERGMP